jgi:hypothetical protein
MLKKGSPSKRTNTLALDHVCVVALNTYSYQRDRAAVKQGQQEINSLFSLLVCSVDQVSVRSSLA